LGRFELVYIKNEETELKRLYGEQLQEFTK